EMPARYAPGALLADEPIDELARSHAQLAAQKTDRTCRRRDDLESVRRGPGLERRPLRAHDGARAFDQAIAVAERSLGEDRREGGRRDARVIVCRPNPRRHLWRGHDPPDPQTRKPEDFGQARR